MFSSEERSVLYSLEMLQALQERKRVHHAGVETGNARFLSMAEILKAKDVQGTLNMREKLRQKIL